MEIYLKIFMTIPNHMDMKQILQKIDIYQDNNYNKTELININNIYIVNERK